jgi:hypothetical protein
MIMENDYAPQGTFAVGDDVVWNSDVLTRYNGREGRITRVINYGEILDLYHVVFEGDDESNFIPAMSNDFLVGGALGREPVEAA